ncbi:MAG: RNA 2'-phosphotransferase, partial [Calditrichaeota bacterium]
SVGARHGSPVVLAISAREMFEAGHAFYHAGRETWLVRSVPREYLQVLPFAG